MSTTIAEQILAASGMAYLLVDRSLIIRGAGGDDAVIAAIGAADGQPLAELLPELYGSEEALTEILSGRLDRLHVPEVNRNKPSGEVRYLDLLTLPQIAAGGQVAGLIQVIADSSERGAAVQARVQQRNEYRLLKEQVSQQNIDLARTNAELRRATQLKDEFLAGISHEIRTPLTAVLGLAEVTRAGLAGPLNEIQTENLRGIEESGRHLLTLIGDFLDIAKIEAGRFELQAGPVSVHALCNAAVRMVSEMAVRKKITLTLQITDAVQLIYGDERRLRQALINLLSNAIKFTPAGGAVGLEVQSDSDEESARLCVWDTGIGIAPEDARRLFQPFVQIAGEHQRDQRGSGLGLTLVAQLVEMHGGGLALASEVGTGSRFTITLPWSPAREQALERQIYRLDAAAAEPEPAQLFVEPTGAGRRILLVEDDMASAAMLMGYLQRCDYQVTQAGSAEEALAHVRVQVPDLVITDVRMRGMDGLDLIRSLRAMVATRTTPIVALTALAMPGDRERCLAAGASIYLSKPLPLWRLAAAVGGLLP